jgi:fatty-acyl-CoA synthase
MSAAVGMPDAYAGEAPILFAAPAPGGKIDPEELKAYVAQHVLEPPARPKQVVILDAIPTTAVGKIFKPALRDLAIRENALLEVERIFGPSIRAEIKVEKDDKLRTVVTVVIDSADRSLRAQLLAELAKLPQTYVLASSECEGGGG